MNITNIPAPILTQDPRNITSLDLNEVCNQFASPAGGISLEGAAIGAMILLLIATPLLTWLFYNWIADSKKENRPSPWNYIIEIEKGLVFACLVLMWIAILLSIIAAYKIHVLT